MLGKTFKKKAHPRNNFMFLEKRPRRHHHHPMGQASFQVRAPGGYSQLVARKHTQKSLQTGSCDSCTKIATQHGLEPSIKILTGLDAENQSLPRQKNGGSSVWMVLLCFFSPARVSEIQNMETIISRIVAKDMSWFTLNLGKHPKKACFLA